MSSKTFIIVGMHRSGTSLTAHWLHECGLFLGEKMVGAEVGNENGHFEDEEFNFLQHEILEENNFSYKVEEGQKIIINDSFVKRANSLVSRRNLNLSQWGWKDPRTCLFLDFWHQQIPNPFYLIVFRSFEEVSDSLWRREMKKFKYRKNKVGGFFQKKNHIKNYTQLIEQNLKTWIRHNDDILSFLETKNPESFLVVSAGDIVLRDKKIFEYLTKIWGFDLSYVDINKLFENKKMTRENKIEVNKEIRQKAESVFEKLIILQNKSLKKISEI